VLVVIILVKVVSGIWYSRLSVVTGWILIPLLVVRVVGVWCMLPRMRVP